MKNTDTITCLQETKQALLGHIAETQANLDAVQRTLALLIGKPMTRAMAMDTAKAAVASASNGHATRRLMMRRGKIVLCEPAVLEAAKRCPSVFTPKEVAAALGRGLKETASIYAHLKTLIEHHQIKKLMPGKYKVIG